MPQSKDDADELACVDCGEVSLIHKCEECGEPMCGGCFTAGGGVCEDCYDDAGDDDDADDDDAEDCDNA